MLVAGWSLTKACNLNCIHCYNASGKRNPNELILAECELVVDKLKNAGTIAINFGGGECALHPDFIPLCQYIKNKDIKISYTTNGTTYSRIKDHLDLFHDIGVSVDFADGKKHDWFRGKIKTFKSAVSTLEHLVKNNVENEIVTCLTKLNCSEKELKKLYELGKDLNVDSWRLNRFRSNGRGIKNEHLLKLSKEDLQKSFKYLSQYTNPEVLTPEPLFRSAFGGTYYFPGDPSGFTSFRIQHNGEVSPSVFLSESGGNIRYDSVSKILNSDIFKKIRKRKPKGKCKGCNSYYHCRGGDAGASYLEYNHFNGPDPLCWLNGKEKPNIKQNKKENWNVHELYLCTLYISMKDKNELPRPKGQIINQHEKNN